MLLGEQVALDCSSEKVMSEPIVSMASAQSLPCIVVELGRRCHAAVFDRTGLKQSSSCDGGSVPGREICGHNGGGVVSGGDGRVSLWGSMYTEQYWYEWLLCAVVMRAAGYGFIGRVRLGEGHLCFNL